MRLRTLQSPVGAEIIIDGKRYVNFGGSSYLGLAANAQILAAGVEALHDCGSGAPLSRFHEIFTPAHEAAELEATRFFSAPAAFFLVGGYYFGLVALAAIREDFHAIFFDELSHYSLREAIAASGLRHHAFRHLDAEDLRVRLNQHLRAGERPLIVTDGMFSTFGAIAPLDELARVMSPFGGRMVVDESHSFGVLGPTGRGACEHHSIGRAAALIGGSLGKAFGTCGGIIPATGEEVAAFCRTPTGRGASIGLPAAAAMCATSLSYVRQHPELLMRLRTNVAYAKRCLRELGLNVPDSPAPVASFVPSSEALHERLLSRGIFVYHSRYIGTAGSGVIRCGIFADHTYEHFDYLIDALRSLL